MKIMRRTIILVVVSICCFSAKGQFSIGPGARCMYVASKNVFKLAPALELSYALNHRWRVAAGGYWLLPEENHYAHTWYDPSVITVHSTYRYTGWGLNIGVERTLGRKAQQQAFFLYGGLGYMHYRIYHGHRAVDGDGYLISGYERVSFDRKLMLETGIGKLWKLGPGQLRAAFNVALVGYHVDKDNTGFRAYPMVGASLGYQFSIGRRARKAVGAE